MNQEFSTFDLGLAAVLLTLKYELLELDRSYPKKIRFVFKRERNIEQVINDYFDDKIELPAQSLLQNQKNLKNRIYSDA
jgi:UTP-glucose-1-phosphate uridylyltransferase